MRDLALRQVQSVAFDAGVLGGQVEEHLARSSSSTAQLRRHAGRGAAAGGPAVHGRAIGVGHHELHGINADAQLFGHGLTERRADVLTHFGLAGVGGHLSGLVNVQPSRQLRRPAAGSAAASPRRLLGIGLIRQETDDNAAPQDLAEVAAVDFELVMGRFEQLVALGFDRVRGQGPKVRGQGPGVGGQGFHRAPPFFGSAACWTACTILAYVPQRQMLPFMACTMSDSFGLGLLFSSATPDMIIPGVQ